MKKRKSSIKELKPNKIGFQSSVNIYKEKFSNQEEITFKPKFSITKNITFASSATSEFGFGEPLKIEN